MTKYMSDSEWRPEDVIREFGEYCSLDVLRDAMVKVVNSNNRGEKNTYKRKMNLVRTILRKLGYRDIPYRTNYYKKEKNNE